MERKMVFFLAIMGILFLIGTGSSLNAQTTTDPAITGYFVSINLQPAGPFDTAGLRQLIGNGQLTRDSLVWKEGMTNWAMAGTIAELAPLFSVAPPPLPGAPPPLAQTPPAVTAPPPQPASQAVQVEPWGGHPVVAGFVNTAFGIWSFTNKDLSGGLLTAGLEAGGITLWIIGSSLYSSLLSKGSSTTVPLIMYYAGYGVLAGGSIYGFVRGYTQYNKKTIAAGSLTEALSDNPLNNISLVAFPTSDGKYIAGAVMYSLAY